MSFKGWLQASRHSTDVWHRACRRWSNQAKWDTSGAILCDHEASVEPPWSRQRVSRRVFEERWIGLLRSGLLASCVDASFICFWQRVKYLIHWPQVLAYEGTFTIELSSTDFINNDFSSYDDGRWPYRYRAKERRWIHQISSQSSQSLGDMGRDGEPPRGRKGEGTLSPLTIHRGFYQYVQRISEFPTSRSRRMFPPVWFHGHSQTFQLPGLNRSWWLPKLSPP
jgi:hypothetical protein